MDTNIKPTVISIFAGGDGSSLGYKWAGYNELLAIDFDKNATDTLKLNFDFPVWNADITKISSKKILEFCKIKPSELSVLDGSPPCQGFSTAGKRNINDSRNDLFLHFIKLIKGLKPKTFLMENVSGMIKGKYKGKFNEILNAFKALNYNVKCKLMNSMWYDVPQSKARLIFIGVRKDLKKSPSFPKPNKKVISIKEVIDNLNTITAIKLKSEWYTYELWNKMNIGESGQKYHPKSSAFNFIKINPFKPCPTIPKSLFVGNKNYGVLCHWNEARSLSIEEIKRFSSFPDDYKLIGKIEDQWAKIGNAVMPKMMYHIANHIKKNIL